MFPDRNEKTEMPAKESEKPVSRGYKMKKRIPGIILVPQSIRIQNKYRRTI